MMRHTDTQYEAELQALAGLFTQMGNRAILMMADAQRALLLRDPELARYVVTSDNELDRMEMEADRRCLSILARRSPVGEDLRLVPAVLKSVTDVERVGDLAVNIAERALDLHSGPGGEPGDYVVERGKASQSLLERSLDAFRRRDSAAARALHATDLEVDQLNRDAFRRLLDLAAAHPDQMERVMALASICRHMERVGDHAVNIGERVVFLVEGLDVRHGG